MKIILVSMPWASIDTPSLALGILTSRIREKFPQIDLETIYANVACAEWLTTVVSEAGREDYDFFALESYFLGCGDWVFSSALYQDPDWRTTEFIAQLSGSLSAKELEMCLLLHAKAGTFIEAQAQSIADARPDLVCFTSTFQQNVASLALARRLKELLPDVKCAMGGANCDGDQGKGLHEAFDFVDYVVRGEGERSFPALVQSILDNDKPSHVPGLCWRQGAKSVANPMTDQLIGPAEIPMPDYDAYFDRVSSTEVSSWFAPRLVVEAARGCWWGEKHHCTFCGLNGSAMTFRSKSPSTFTEELESLSRRYRVLDFFAVDNILEMGYVDTAVAEIAEGPFDYRIQYEIKSNMRYSQLKRLRDAGIISVQPGIENLDSSVLKIMDKGVSGTQNVRMLRDAESLGLTVAWNYLYGFPGENTENYTSVIVQMPALHHLFPPGGASRIALERFSPYFDRPELGFGYRWPHRQYGMIYELQEEELRNIAYLFETEPRGIDKHVASQLDNALERWEKEHSFSYLHYEEEDGTIFITNGRPGFDWTTTELNTEVERVLFKALDQPRTSKSLCTHLKSISGRTPKDAAATVQEIISRWQDLGIIFENSGRYVHVVTSAENQKHCRIVRHTNTEMIA